jgi:glycosyltransferase involved in cell wall biosynthesis
MTVKSQRRSTSRPRVLFFSHETTLSGAPMQLLHLIKAMNEQGWDAVFAAPEPGPISDLLKGTGTRVEIDSSFLVDTTHQQLRTLCRKFDLVVANTITSWPAVEAAHQETVPAIWYIHETLVAARFLKQVWQASAALHVARLIVVPTEQTAGMLKGATKTRIVTVPYGIPDMADLAPKKKANGKKISFAAVGSFEPRKGQDILVEAIGRLNRGTRDKASFKLAGRVLDPKFFGQLQKRIAKFKSVELIESPDHETALQLLTNADALICPSRDETMPITIIEAARSGKAIISTDIGGIAEWIRNGLNGVLVPAENPAALADAIARCGQDRQLLDRLGAAARRTYERHFRLDRFTKDFTALIEQARQPEAKPIVSARAKYERWIAAFDQENASNRLAVSRRVRQLPRHPLISILLPVYNSDLRFLRAAIDSVRNQIYPQWELCIADDASTDAEVRPFLEETARRDTRIKVIFRETNGHISACSNSALALASGEWCVLLDQDDVLAQKALAFVAAEIDAHPEAGLIYSDEDKIDIGGGHFDPFFKPEWSLEEFLGHNFINHLGGYRTSILRRIGGFREGFEGSQDYDLALRCVEHLRPEQIRHIPRVLYHWRAVHGSLALESNAKPYARVAGRRAIAEYLQRCRIAARVEASPENVHVHRVIYDLPASLPLVSIIIPTRDRLHLLQQCVQSLRAKTDYPRLELIIVDNGSAEKKTQRFLEKIEKTGAARVLREPGPFNFSRLNNAAAAVAGGELLAFVNSDITVENPDWLREMLRHAVRPETGAVGARLWFPDGTLQHGGVVLGLGGIAGHANYRVPRGATGYYGRILFAQNCSAVTAACMVMRKKLFLDLGGFDELNLKISFNDVDLCLQLREHGYQIIWTPYANLIHHESASRGHQPTPKENAEFFREATFMQRKWGATLLNDPFYNPNLTLNWPGFDFAFPPRWKTCSSAVAIAA